jgi:hypothetical protein
MRVSLLLLFKELSRQPLSFGDLIAGHLALGDG